MFNGEILTKIEVWLGWKTLAISWLLLEGIRYCHYCIKNWEKRRKYNQWIRRALQEREEKKIEVLRERKPDTTSNGSTEAVKESISSTQKKTDSSCKTLFSAVETTRRIRNGDLDMQGNIVHLAKACRKYGRSLQVNAIAEELYDEAWKQAGRLLEEDQNTKANGSVNWNRSSRKFSLLYGVPISVKESFPIAGTYTTCGLACRLEKRSTTDALLVRVLKEQGGAIPICKGNAMQILFALETNNRIWGRSSNPWDFSRTPGGSSGGDAALVAMGCVPLAIGTDLGGSIRIPAAFCGIIGFKPTSTRLSTKGVVAARKGGRNGAFIQVPSSIGPLARTVDDCATFMEAVCVPEMWLEDTSVPPLPFDTVTYRSERPLRIGYFDSDEWFEPCLAARRAVKETITGLITAGHTCVRFEMPTKGKFNHPLFTSINCAEGRFRMPLEALDGEPIVPEFRFFAWGCNMPDSLRWLIRKLTSSYRKAYLLGRAKRNGQSAKDYYGLLADILEMQRAWSEAVSAAGVDALIFPAFALAPPHHGRSSPVLPASSFVFLANLLQWPCGTVPVTTIREDEQGYYSEPGEEDCLPEDQRDRIAELADTIMKDSAGLPMSVSVMAPAFRDEACLRAMREVEAVARFTARPPDILGRPPVPMDAR